MVEAIRQGDIPGVQLRRRQSLDLTPQEVWAWLTEPGKLALWLADEAEVTEKELLLRGSDASGQGWRERGRTLEAVPPSRWVLAFERLDSGWPFATRLTLQVHPLREGSEIDVLQEGFQRLPLSTGLTVWEAYRLRWRTALEKLAQASAALS